MILVRSQTVPDDIHGMFVSQGILTATGGMTSHAAVVGRQMGKPSVVGAGDLQIDEGARQFRVGGKTVKEGDYISFDGLSGEVKIARVGTKPSEILQVLNGTLPPKRSAIYQRFERLLSWADKVRRLGVYANADLPDQAELAYAFGARGIGLCRTEHMFFGEGRIPIVQRMILAEQRSRSAAGAERAAAAPARGFLRRLQGDARLPGDHPHHRPTAPRVPAQARGSHGRRRAARGQRQEAGPRAGGKAPAAGPRRAAPRVQPDARPPRRPPRHHLPRDHRDADPRHHRSGLPPEQGRDRRSRPRS